MASKEKEMTAETQTNLSEPEPETCECGMPCIESGNPDSPCEGAVEVVDHYYMEDDGEEVWVHKCEKHAGPGWR